ncbi:hypothetical protein AUR64_09435 [Haloprofundus marisrubri]|uniref:DUF7344 domain-containing protein n=1 Tax=Haloprofundus marisrubri TaxID=1514971 RepID=A0A0W1R8W5_9EURY|nr:hypothetical protein [Haloprofundus marisrubri]KTG09841.1 hypothetical protein AUR64_09435 [Haloprofundus marisrubri]
MTHDDTRTTEAIPPRVQLNGVFVTLASTTRRWLLLDLIERSPREERTVSEELAAVWGVDRGRVQTQLRHVHLPKLVAAGYVQWDETTGEIRRGPALSEVEPVLQLLDDNADSLPGRWP